MLTISDESYYSLPLSLCVRETGCSMAFNCAVFAGDSLICEQILPMRQILPFRPSFISAGTSGT